MIISDKWESFLNMGSSAVIIFPQIPIVRKFTTIESFMIKSAYSISQYYSNTKMETQKCKIIPCSVE